MPLQLPPETDARRLLLRALKRDLGIATDARGSHTGRLLAGQGTMVAFNQAFELAMLRHLAWNFPEEADWLDALADRRTGGFA